MKKVTDKKIQADFGVKQKKAKLEYKYQPELTDKLDNYKGQFTETTLLEIVLWKVNRYPTITEDLLKDINGLRASYSDKKAKKVLSKLLQKGTRGFDLPMASAVLRFACPDHLQIIDQRVYRFIMPEKEKLSLPKNIEEKIELYFKYIQRLKEICVEYDITFNTSDRILYQLDKKYNKKFPIHGKKKP